MEEEEEKFSKKLMISCREAGLLITIKQHHGELTFYQKVQLAFHNMICKVCKLWAKQSSQLSNMLKDAFSKEDHKLADEKKEKMEKDLDELFI